MNIAQLRGLTAISKLHLCKLCDLLIECIKYAFFLFWLVTLNCDNLHPVQRPKNSKCLGQMSNFDFSTVLIQFDGFEMTILLWFNGFKCGNLFLKLNGHSMVIFILSLILFAVNHLRTEISQIQNCLNETLKMNLKTKNTLTDKSIFVERCV